MINNGTLHYDHDRDGTHTQIAGCEAKFRNIDYDTHIAIRYEKDTLTGTLNQSNLLLLSQCNYFLLKVQLECNLKPI